MNIPLSIFPIILLLVCAGSTISAAYCPPRSPSVTSKSHQVLGLSAGVETWSAVTSRRSHLPAAHDDSSSFWQKVRAGGSTALMSRENDDDMDDEKSNLDNKNKSSDNNAGNIGDSEGDESDIDTTANAAEEKKKVAAKPPSTTRVGGRSRLTSLLPSKSDSSKFDFKPLLQIGLPVALLLAFLKLLLGGIFSPSGAPNYVYYQSSMYESRTMGADGNVQTTRKESMRSNMPSLVNGATNEGNGRSEIRRYLDSKPDKALDAEIDSEVKESMKEAREMMRGMGFTDFSSLDPYPTRDYNRGISVTASDLDREIENDIRRSMREFDKLRGMSLWDDLASFDRY